MNTLDKLRELTQRLEHLDHTGEWLAETLSGKDEVVAQTGKLITTLSEDIRYRIIELVTELEKQALLTANFKH